MLRCCGTACTPAVLAANMRCNAPVCNVGCFASPLGGRRAPVLRSKPQQARMHRGCLRRGLSRVTHRHCVDVCTSHPGLPAPAVDDLHILRQRIQEFASACGPNCGLATVNQCARPVAPIYMCWPRPAGWRGAEAFARTLPWPPSSAPTLTARDHLTPLGTPLAGRAVLRTTCCICLSLGGPLLQRPRQSK